MASGVSAVWAIDIGNNSLKALKLTDENGFVEVTGFDSIAHDKMLTTPGITPEERDELVALSLRKFVKQNEIGKSNMIVSVPSQNSFARFVNLPPVEEKRIPEIIKFEAAQQIPFDINDVQWDWQQMNPPGSKDIRAGIFAIKNEIVSSLLDYFSNENLAVTHVQMSSMALYNYVLYDRPELFKTDKYGVVILDIGTDSSDLVVATSSTVWQRSISIGGNNFTRAISEAFKLNFKKAEKLKRTAPMSKYARQIFQAMRPVFADMASEIQRSLGYYSSSNPDTKLKYMVAFGGGAKLQGLLKYFQQSLQMPVEAPDAFKNLKLSEYVSAAKFHDNVSDFGVVYGLGLQVMGLGKIESNLLPASLARSMAWAAKSKFFIAAASVFLVAAILGFARTTLDKMNYQNQQSRRASTDSIVAEATEAQQAVDTQAARASESQIMIQKQFDLFKYRQVIPFLRQLIINSLPNENNNPSQKPLYDAFRKGDVDAVTGFKRKERKQIFITYMSIDYSTDLDKAQFRTVPFTSGGSSVGTPRTYNTNYPSPTYVAPAAAEVTTNPDGTEIVPQVPSGFVVTIAGYSPYKDIGELIDPIGVGDDQSKWGLVTRLMHLNQIVEPNCPFELYKKGDAPLNFNFDKGEVSFEKPMPLGIGQKIQKTIDVSRTAYNRTSVSDKIDLLIDPMTKETVSKFDILDENGNRKVERGKVLNEINDSWFKLDLKFQWKDAPAQPIIMMMTDQMSAG